MRISLIRERLKVCSKGMDEANLEATQSQNQHMQDFIIWLSGYMDGIEDKEGFSTVKMMVDELKAKK